MGHTATATAVILCFRGLHTSNYNITQNVNGYCWNVVSLNKKLVNEKTQTNFCFFILVLRIQWDFMMKSSKKKCI